MRDIYVNLPGSDEIQHFVDTISPLSGQFDFIFGNYILDARSLMGIFSLEIEKPLLLRVHQDTAENMSAIAPFASAQQ